MAIAENMRESVEQAIIPCTDGKTTRLTISIGINVIIPLTVSSVHDFVTKADNALYTAKNEGRNKVCVNPEVIGESSEENQYSEMQGE
jgi:diguanylate cyclase